MRTYRAEFTELIDPLTALTASSWPIADRYRYSAGWISPQWDKEQWSFLFPLYAPDLFWSFARLNAHGEPSKNAILRWVEKHGLLLRQDENRSVWNKLENGELNQAPITLEKFGTEVRRAYWLVSVYADVKSRDVQALKARASNPRSALDKRLARDFYDSFEEVSFTVTPSSKETEVLWLAFTTVAEVVEEALTRVRLGTRFGSPDEFDPKSPRFGQAWYCPDLLSAIYLQFYLLLTANRPMHRCENPACRLPFPVTRKNKRFCNDTCRSNARYHRRRLTEDAKYYNGDKKRDDAQ